MSYESLISNLGTYMNMQTLGLYNSMAPMGYLGSSLGMNLPFSNVMSNVLQALAANGLNAGNIAGFRTISADSALQKALNELGYGNMLILVPEEYQKQVEENAENAQKLGETFKKWKANYNTVNVGKSRGQGSAGNQRRGLTGASHNCSLRNCTFGRSV